MRKKKNRMGDKERKEIDRERERNVRKRKE